MLIKTYENDRIYKKFYENFVNSKTEKLREKMKERNDIDIDEMVWNALNYKSDFNLKLDKIYYYVNRDKFKTAEEIDNLSEVGLNIIEKFLFKSLSMYSTTDNILQIPIIDRNLGSYDKYCNWNTIKDYGYLSNKDEFISFFKDFNYYNEDALNIFKKELEELYERIDYLIYECRYLSSIFDNSYDKHNEDFISSAVYNCRVGAEILLHVKFYFEAIFSMIENIRKNEKVVKKLKEIKKDFFYKELKNTNDLSLDEKDQIIDILSEPISDRFNTIILDYFKPY